MKSNKKSIPKYKITALSNSTDLLMSFDLGRNPQNLKIGDNVYLSDDNFLAGTYKIVKIENYK